MAHVANALPGLSATLVRQNEKLKKNLRKPLAAPRVALSRKISLKFPHFQGFLTEYSSNLSVTGMFVKTNNLEPPGTTVDFEFLLPDGLKLIRGKAEVVWIRDRADGPEQPIGMGLRFVRLDAESRRMIRWTVEKQVLEKGSLVDMEELMSCTNASIEHVEDVRRVYPYAGAAFVRPKTLRQRLAALALPAAFVAAFCVAVALGGIFSSGQQSRGATPLAATPLATASLAAAGLEGHETQPAETLAAWAEAWSAQRVDDYLAFYSPEFRPPRGMSRATWSAQRAARISKPSFIKVEIEELETTVMDRQRARVSFLQLYESDRYHDATRKTVDLRLEGAHWKIVGEQSEAVETPASHS